MISEIFRPSFRRKAPNQHRVLTKGALFATRIGKSKLGKMIIRVPHPDKKLAAKGATVQKVVDIAEFLAKTLQGSKKGLEDSNTAIKTQTEMLEKMLGNNLTETQNNRQVLSSLIQNLSTNIEALGSKQYDIYIAALSKIPAPDNFAHIFGGKRIISFREIEDEANNIRREDIDHWLVHNTARFQQFGVEPKNPVTSVLAGGKALNLKNFWNLRRPIWLDLKTNIYIDEGSIFEFFSNSAARDIMANADGITKVKDDETGFKYTIERGGQIIKELSSVGEEEIEIEEK